MFRRRTVYIWLSLLATVLVGTVVVLSSIGYYVSIQPAAYITEDELAKSLQTHVTASFAFSRQAILAFKKNDIDEKGRRGTLLFTGATASIRGNVITSAFAAGKFGLRALSQSLAKEFGKENIHVSTSTMYSSCWF